MRAHFVNMPSELSDAARVDGASTWDLFWQIHLPLARRADCFARDPHDRLDVEPVSPAAGARRGPKPADDGWWAGSLPGPLCQQCPLAVCRHDIDPGAHPRHLHIIPTSDHHSPTPGLGKGVSAGLGPTQSLFS